MITKKKLVIAPYIWFQWISNTTADAKDLVLTTEYSNSNTTMFPSNVSTNQNGTTFAIENGEIFSVFDYFAQTSLRPQYRKIPQDSVCSYVRLIRNNPTT
jgi:hypothetical protein